MAYPVRLPARGPTQPGQKPHPSADMNIRSASLSALASVLLVATLASPAQAQTKPSRTVNRDELRACMASESDLASRRAAMEERNKVIGAENAEIKAQGQELKEEKERLDRDQKPLERFERKVKVYNARVLAARNTADAFQADLVALTRGWSRKRPVGRHPYEPDDKAASSGARGGQK